jgi:flagellar biogenesis protein FliO
LQACSHWRQVPVGARANLALVRVGRSVLLIGVTQNTVTLIKDLEQGDFEKTIQEAGA